LSHSSTLRGADRFIPDEIVAEVRKQFEFKFKPKPGIEIFSYPDVDHGFNSEDRRAYNPEAQLAGRRTAAILTAAILDALR
jgi:dienelactone hydrolase